MVARADMFPGSAMTYYRESERLDRRSWQNATTKDWLGTVLPGLKRYSGKFERLAGW